MKTKTITVYSFDELSEDAKQTAIENWRNNEDYSFITSEASNTLDKFCEIFDINWRNFDYCEMYRSEWTFNFEDTILNLSGLRLAKYIWNNYKSQIFKGKYYGKLVKTFKDGSPIPVSKEHPNGTRHVKRYSRCTIEHSCVLTGWCYDEDVLQPIYEFLNKPNERIDFETLLNDCLHSLGHSVCSEIEANGEDEAIIETIQANDYEFDEDGNML